MKKRSRYIICTAIVLIFILSCASTTNKNKMLNSNPSIEYNDSIKDKYEALNDYFDTEITDQSQKVIIMKEKISTNMTLKLLKINDIWAIDSTGMGRKDETFYKEEEWEKLRKKNGNSSLDKIQNAHLEKGECCWGSTNFRHKEIIFEDLEFAKSDFEKKYFFSPSYYVYWFSEPIYYKDKEYIIFTTDKGSLSGFVGTTHLIMMKKMKNKWVQLYEGKPDWRN